jgi:hypothetical protein
MKIEFEKVMHITGELLSYCHLRGASDFHFELSVAKKDATRFEIKASPTRLSGEELSLLEKNLNKPRRPEIEQEFWGLSGESETSSEISLVGMMTDEAQIKYDETNFVLNIKLKRKNP